MNAAVELEDRAAHDKKKSPSVADKISPQNAIGYPPKRHRLTPNRRRLPPNRRRLPPNRHRVPPNRHRTPPNRRRLPANGAPSIIPVHDKTKQNQLWTPTDGPAWGWGPEPQAAVPLNRRPAHIFVLVGGMEAIPVRLVSHCMA